MVGRLELDLLAEQCHHFTPVFFRHRTCALEDFGETSALHLAELEFQFSATCCQPKAPDTAIIAVSRLSDIPQIDHLFERAVQVLLGDAQCLDPKVKSLNYLNNILARIEANHADCDEALMLNTDGYVSEGSVDNIFIVVDAVLKTPPLEDGMLDGITRAVVIDVATAAGIPCEQVSLRVSDLQQGEECFLTGTGAELIPVRQIGEHVFGAAQNPQLPIIMQGFKNSIAQYCSKP